MRLRDACRYRDKFSGRGYTWRVWAEDYPACCLQINYGTLDFPNCWVFLHSVHDAKAFLRLADKGKIWPIYKKET